MNNKLSVSNIAWTVEQDENIYNYLAQHCFAGLEIAPTRIFPVNPYQKIDEARKFSNELYRKYKLKISSLQSIWYGKAENIFESEEDRTYLLKYTKQAIVFARNIQCDNLVFGCPQNRNRKSRNIGKVIKFFEEVGDYAAKYNIVIALEANPKIYNTDFINYTKEAFELVKQISSPGFKVNLDTGAMIANKETVRSITADFSLIHHIHISEPFLKPLQKRKMHVELRNLICDKEYNGYISLEMGVNTDTFFDSISYFEDMFG